MDYDLSQMRWEGDIFSLFNYVPWGTGYASKETNLILNFKRNSPRDVEQIKEAAIEAFSQAEEDLRDLECRYIVAIPSREAETPNAPCEAVCAALADHFDWLIHLPGALKRVTTVPKSATAGKEGRPRPSYKEHVNSIQYVGPSIVACNQSIIMVDDVYTRGATSQACRTILMRATGCTHVIGFFIGRTRFTI